MSNWLANLQDLSGEHPEARKASTPPVRKEKRGERDGLGSLDLGEYQLSVVEDRNDGEPMVETPLRADGLGEGKKRIHLRLSEELERFLYANTRGSVNAVVAALVVYGFQELQKNHSKLALIQAVEEIQAKASQAGESGNPDADQGSAQ